MNERRLNEGRSHVQNTRTVCVIHHLGARQSSHNPSTSLAIPFRLVCTRAVKERAHKADNEPC